MQKKVNGIIIQNKVIFESDRLITLLSLEKGRFNVLAKYAAKSKKRFAGRLLLFNEIAAQINIKNKLPQLLDCHLLTHHSVLSSHYNALCLAGYCAQLITKITIEYQHIPKLYHCYKTTLKNIQSNPNNYQVIKKEFETSLLYIEGLTHNSTQPLSPTIIKEKLHDYIGHNIPEPQWL
ncbi:MAG: DNA repair protein RecO [bacterium]